VWFIIVKALSVKSLFMGISLVPGLHEEPLAGNQIQAGAVICLLSNRSVVVG
jgi:hypothetical protein